MTSLLDINSDTEIRLFLGHGECRESANRQALNVSKTLDDRILTARVPCHLVNSDRSLVTCVMCGHSAGFGTVGFETLPGSTTWRVPLSVLESWLEPQPTLMLDLRGETLVELPLYDENIFPISIFPGHVGVMLTIGPRRHFTILPRETLGENNVLRCSAYGNTPLRTALRILGDRSGETTWLVDTGALEEMRPSGQTSLVESPHAA